MHSEPAACGLLRTLPTNIWRVQWPSDITNNVVSDANPKGTNSDLELAAVVLQEAVLEARLGPSIAGTQAAIGSDNTQTVAWSTRMASRSGSPISFRLLRGRAICQRTNRSAPIAVFNVAGIKNILADVASRPVTGIASHHHMFENDPSAMCPKDFLTHFTTSYPLPQQRPWLNVQPPSGLWSNVISTLRGQRLELQRWTMKCDKLGGITGPPMQADAASTRGCASNPSPKNKPTCLPLPPGFELESSGERSKLDTSLWKKPSVTWHKPSSWPDLTTRDEATGPAS